MGSISYKCFRLTEEKVLHLLIWTFHSCGFLGFYFYTKDTVNLFWKGIKLTFCVFIIQSSFQHCYEQPFSQNSGKTVKLIKLLTGHVLSLIGLNFMLAPCQCHDKIVFLFYLLHPPLRPTHLCFSLSGWNILKIVCELMGSTVHAYEADWQQICTPITPRYSLAIKVNVKIYRRLR